VSVCESAWASTSGDLPTSLLHPPQRKQGPHTRSEFDNEHPVIGLWPPLLGFLSKLAPKGGETVNGISYPEGTGICVCPMGVGRCKDIFGKDADIFRPDC
jgi:hypothetical protein